MTIRIPTKTKTKTIKTIKGGKKHSNGQDELLSILKKYYSFVELDFEVPIPNHLKYYDQQAKTLMEYKLDVYAEKPLDGVVTPYPKLGIEVDGKIGHKTSKHQDQRDRRRTLWIKSHYGVYIHRFDSEQLTGTKGYRSKKTQQITVSVLSENEILEHLCIASVNLNKHHHHHHQQ